MMDVILLIKDRMVHNIGTIMLIVNRMDHCLDAIMLFSNHKRTENKMISKSCTLLSFPILSSF